MRQKFTLSIPAPCAEDWNQFTHTEKGRFCGTCQKEVIDFTSWSDEEIKQYFLTRPASTCGRFAVHQLTTYPPEVRSNHPTRWAAIIAVLLSLISRPSEAQQTRPRAGQEQIDQKSTVSPKPKVPVVKLTVRGKVVSQEDGSSLPGVNIMRKGTNQGTVSDADGNYELVIDRPKTIETMEYFFIGLKTIEQPVRADTTFQEVNIRMTLDEVALSEVVVVGGVCVVRWYNPRRIWWGITRIFRRK